MNIFDRLFGRRSGELLTGLIPNPEADNDPRNLRFEDIAPFGGEMMIPESGDVEDEHWTLNQGSTAACTCFSTVYKINQVIPGRKLSPRYAYWKIKKDPKYGSSQLPWGAYMVDSLKLVVNEGICSLNAHPNGYVTSDDDYLRDAPSDFALREADRFKGGSYLYVTSGADDLAKFDAIRLYMATMGRACKVGVNWRTSFNKARKGGVVPAEPATGKTEGHDMMAVAWKLINGHEYIGFRNSWGLSWGDNGRIWLPKGFFKIQTSMDYLPPAITEAIEIKKPTTPVVARDIHLERSVAQNLQDVIYKEFPLNVLREAQKQNIDARSLAGRSWLVLVPAVTYRKWTTKDVINYLYARSRRITDSPAYSLDFNKERYV